MAARHRASESSDTRARCPCIGHAHLLGRSERARLSGRERTAYERARANPVKILFVTKTLSATGGGAERVLAAISAELARRGHEVIVATFDPAGAGTFYPFSSRIRLVNLAIGDSSKTTTFPEFVRRIGALRALAAKIRPDVAIGFMHSSFVPLALGLRGSGVPVVGSEHSPYEHYHKRPVDRMGLAIAAPLLARITAISE